MHFSSSLSRSTNKKGRYQTSIFQCSFLISSASSRTELGNVFSPTFWCTHCQGPPLQGYHRMQSTRRNYFIPARARTFHAFSARQRLLLRCCHDQEWCYPNHTPRYAYFSQFSNIASRQLWFTTQHLLSKHNEPFHSRTSRWYSSNHYSHEEPPHQSTHSIFGVWCFEVHTHCSTNHNDYYFFCNTFTNCSKECDCCGRTQRSFDWCQESTFDQVVSRQCGPFTNSIDHRCPSLLIR